MAKVLIRGPLLSQSGYGVHCRQVFKWLLKSGHDISCQILPWGVTPWYLNAGALGGLVGEIMERSTPPTTQFDISFQVQLPDEWDTSLAKKNIFIAFNLLTANICVFSSPSWRLDFGEMFHPPPKY